MVHADRPDLFEMQRDPVAVRMAAFVSGDPDDREAFMTKWDRLLGDDAIVARTITLGDAIAGSVVRYPRAGKPEITYGVRRDLWGRGVATAALTLFLAELTERPLHAGAASDNHASLRVLQKCGFVEVERETGYAGARGREVEEIRMILR